MEEYRLSADRPAAKAVPRRRVTLWAYVNDRGRVAITPDPDELPGGAKWFTRWHGTKDEAVAEAVRWLESRGLEAGEVVAG